MAFTLQTWSRVSVSANEPYQLLPGNIPVGSNKGFNYTSPDAQAAIAAADYFDPVGTEIQTGDWVVVYSTGDAAITFYQLINNAGVITTVPFNLINVINTANIVNLAVTAAKIANNTITDTQVLLNGLSSASLNKSLIQFASGQLSAANVAAMYGAPIQLLAGQGANTLIMVADFSIEMPFNTTQYTGGGNVGLQYGNAAHLAGPAASVTFANGAGNNLRAAQTQVTSIEGALSNQQGANTINTGIFISNDTAAFATGDSVVNWYMSYRVFTTT